MRVEQWDENGDRSSRAEVDTLDVRAWDSRTTSYLDTDVVALSETTLDSGDEIIFAYQTETAIGASKSTAMTVTLGHTA